jgi:molecular chaperone GrpE
VSTRTLDFSGSSADIPGERIARGNNAMMDSNPADGAPEAAAPTDEAKIAALVEALSKESAEYKDKLLRTLAEMENLRRRTEREIADSRTYGISNFARDILGVADNMARSLSAVGTELREKADAALKGLLEGVELTERELQKVLEKHGIRKLDPLGQKFDPNLHQAMFEIPDPSQPAGTVAQVMQPGYTIGERVLRPALVGVTKGGPKPEPKTEAKTEARSESKGEPPASDNAGAASSEP